MHFYFFLSSLHAFLFLTALTKTSNTMLNRRGEIGQPCCVLALNTQLFISEYDVIFRFFTDVLFQV